MDVWERILSFSEDLLLSLVYMSWVIPQLKMMGFAPRIMKQLILKYIFLGRPDPIISPFQMRVFLQVIVEKQVRDREYQKDSWSITGL